MTSTLRDCRCALVALLILAARATAQDVPAVATRVGVKQPVLAGVLEQPPVLGIRLKGSTITGTTTARVRANVPWQLRVSLVAPVDQTLTASFRIGKGSATALSARQPTAIAGAGATPCVACRVELQWDFTYKAKGSRKPVPVVPKLMFEALASLRG